MKRQGSEVVGKGVKPSVMKRVKVMSSGKYLLEASSGNVILFGALLHAGIVCSAWLSGAYSLAIAWIIGVFFYLAVFQRIKANSQFPR